MKKSNLHAIKELAQQDRWLSMDEYVEFVNFNSLYFRKYKVSKKDEIAMRVNVPFSIKA